MWSQLPGRSERVDCTGGVLSMESVLLSVWLWHSELLQYVVCLSRVCSLNRQSMLLSARQCQSSDGALLGHPAFYMAAARCRQL